MSIVISRPWRQKISLHHRYTAITPFFLRQPRRNNSAFCDVVTPLLPAVFCSVPSWQVHVNTNAVHCTGVAAPTARFLISLCEDEQKGNSIHETSVPPVSLFQWSHAEFSCILNVSKSLPNYTTSQPKMQFSSMYFMFHPRSKLP